MKLFNSLIAAVTLTFAGCNSCYNVQCDSPDVDYINGLQFEFDRAIFDFKEIDNAFVLRFNPGDLEQPVDTLKLKGWITNENRTFHLGTSVFSNAVDFADFEYGIYDNSGEYAFIIRTIATNGHYPTDCCCCYRNRQKTFTMNGKDQDRTGSVEPIILSK